MSEQMKCASIICSRLFPGSRREAPEPGTALQQKPQDVSSAYSSIGMFLHHLQGTGVCLQRQGSRSRHCTTLDSQQGSLQLAEQDTDTSTQGETPAMDVSYSLKATTGPLCCCACVLLTCQAVAHDY